ncbi:ATP-binding protein [Micromonospora zamorensis]|uniref:ATP-binding protein n=1 Tax=Micromonospora zamorensis TaxID=709883 RepID=UPI0036AB7674
MSAEAFVDRETEFALATSLVERACSGHGGFLIIEGAAGIGKSALLRRLAGSRSGVNFLTTQCHVQVGQLEAYGPLLDLLLMIERGRPKHRQLLRRSGESVRAHWPELLAMIPAVGNALKMVAESLSGPVPGAPLVDDRAAARSVAEATLSMLGEKHPAVVTIDDAHRIDGSSCAALGYLARAVRDQPVLFILALRHDELNDNTPARQLVEDLIGQGYGQRMRLGGLPPSAVAELAQVLVGSTALPSVRQLVERTGGHPLVIHYYLGNQRLPAALPAVSGVDLRELPTRRQQSEGIVVERMRMVIQARMRQLTQDEVRLLTIAAVQGRIFQSSIVAQVADENHDQVSDRLYRLARKTGMLHPVEADTWDDTLDADRYSFEHDLLQEILYFDQTERQRRHRHRAIGRILYEHSKNYAGLTQEVALEMIRHHRLGQDWLAAARAAHHVACRLSATGASIREVIGVAEQGLESVRQAPPDPEANRIRAQLIELLLTASELSWRTRPEADGTVRLESLTAEALTAAGASGDASLEVRVRYLRGKVLLYTRGVPAAIGPLQEAWELAVSSGDPENILLAGCEYGRQLPKVDVNAGLAVLQRAEAAAIKLSEHNDDPVVQRARRLVGLQIGVNLFDAGRLGPALDRLRTAVTAVRREPMLGLLPIGLNYLAQVEAAAGNVSDAENLLTEAVGLRDGDEADGWHAVNLAYLGARKVLDRRDPAGLRLLEEAQVEAEETWQANLAPLVANLYAASLLAQLEPAGMDQALTVLEECLAETRRTGMRRSEITTLSLLGEWYLLDGTPQQAIAFSELAIDQIREANWQLAAVCVEDILYRHSRIQRELGDEGGAREFLQRAAAEVHRKADTFAGEPRTRFLTKVPLNQAILAGVEPFNPPELIIP